ncbi:YDG/SRA domain-containing protein [Deinococcus cellulosilyticus]|uniref:YDG domain-containing protein n=1 Tax=Deinococcus cellulosilyticus (strain DSM 18568 / NBRC 106333 / KACC 11606 / 5516J-15) TaxID=1223518 RepID=A0A511NC23_DEIC1|nr:YDG/SRA domain-containing protein [Deinococcus cellulosilyticus]GEM50147.1 hypothetical protein DC3_57820 [Deinococcus cellulosilyticus NBRC 106333 = KACC 11606]
MAERVFGDVKGVPVGALFPDRKAVAAAGIHKPLQAGISGSANEGADSIVVSGGYEDDFDDGETLIYTGHGGRDQESEKQVAHQELTRQNKALALNKQLGLPVRVVRRVEDPKVLSSGMNYRYDGLYFVTDYWCEPGKSGFLVYRFRLEKDPFLVPPMAGVQSDVPEDDAPAPVITTAQAERRLALVNRIKRDSKVTKAVKKMHDDTCQVCGVRLVTPLGAYSEAAHIKPLGMPHNGPDSTDNVLCLCPNHHVLFDYGVFAVNDDFSLVGTGYEGQVLRRVAGHQINLEYLQYQREHYFFLDIRSR